MLVSVVTEKPTSINSPKTGNLLFSPGVKTPTKFCLPSAAHCRVSLQDFASDTSDPPSSKLLMSLSLGLESGQAKELQTCGL